MQSFWLHSTSWEMGLKHLSDKLNKFMTMKESFEVCFPLQDMFTCQGEGRIM